MKVLKQLAISILLLCALAVPGVAAGVSSSEIYSQFHTPQDRYRPFVRWWWNGDKVEAEELVRELHLLKEAGIGGVEINPISFPGKEEAAVGHLSLIHI